MQPKKQEVNKEKRLRIGLCGGFAHCPVLGVELSNPQVTPHIGLKSSFGPLGYGAAMTYSFNTDNRRYDPYVSFSYFYSGPTDSVPTENMPASLNYGAYWRLGEKSPIFLDFQVGAGVDVLTGGFIPSLSLSILGGLF